MKCCDISSGQLRHRVELQRVVKTPDGGGGFDTEWQTYASPKAFIKALSGSERWASDRTEATTRNRATMRFRDDVTESDRVVFRGRAYNIRFIDNVEFRNRWLVIDLDGGVAT